jgi:hypothetical protein
VKRQSQARGVRQGSRQGHSHAVDAVVPEDIGQWRAEANRIAGRTMFTARSRGITFVIVHDEEGWWRVDKIHQGRTICSLVTKHPPERVKNVVLATVRRTVREQRDAD